LTTSAAGSDGVSGGGLGADWSAACTRSSNIEAALYCIEQYGELVYARSMRRTHAAFALGVGVAVYFLGRGDAGMRATSIRTVPRGIEVELR
jgi:hypothetical protein